MKLKTHRTPMTTFTTISLTDIIFLLLIFFLLSSTFILQPGIKVQLPRTTTTEISSEKSIVVSITRDGALFLNEDFVSIEQLGAKLRTMLIDVGNPILIIRADKNILLERMVEVMDKAKGAGAERFLIATQQK